MEECKYKQKRINIENLIDEDLENNESDSNFKDEAKSDVDNDEYDEWIWKSILITIKA